MLTNARPLSDLTGRHCRLFFDYVDLFGPPWDDRYFSRFMAEGRTAQDPSTMACGGSLQYGALPPPFPAERERCTGGIPVA